MTITLVYCEKAHELKPYIRTYIIWRYVKINLAVIQRHWLGPNIYSKYIDIILHLVHTFEFAIFNLPFTLMENHCILLSNAINPLPPEFKIPAEPINTGDKMAAPRREPISLRITLYSPYLQPNRLH